MEDPQVADGDEVVVLPGTYEPQATQLVVDNAITVHGIDGQPMPVVPFPSTVTDDAVRLAAAGATLRWLRIEHDAGSASGLNMGAVTAGVAERVYVEQTGAASSACRLGFSSVIRDSVCWSSGNDGVGVNWQHTGDVNFTSALRNVTAIANGTGDRSGIRVRAEADANLALDAKNTIARVLTGGAGLRHLGDDRWRGRHVGDGQHRLLQLRLGRDLGRGSSTGLARRGTFSPSPAS